MNLLDLKQLVEQYTRNKKDYKLEQIQAWFHKKFN